MAKTVKIKSDGSRSAGRFRLLFYLNSPHERIVDLLNFSPLQKKKEEEEEIMQRQLQREKSIQAQDYLASQKSSVFLGSLCRHN